MRSLLVSLMLAAGPAWAQAPAPQAAPPAKATCAECGVVRSVRSVKKTLGPSPASEAQPSGLVASIPFGGGKAQVGSSTKAGKEAAAVSETWEVAVRLDDGRFRLVTLDEPPDLRAGDRVRFEANGQIRRRTD